ncbi:MAG: cysteine--tRNA ligase [Elusimicrobiota bacterium]
MGIILYNTLTRRREEFSPLGKTVGLYTCGPTVYNYLHVGNYRTYIFEDALRRSLSFAGLSVRHVMNITDVGHLTSQADEGDDKMEVGAAREGKTAWEIAEFYTQSFLEDSKALGLLPPDVLCKATAHIPEQIALISSLEAKGFTYRTDDGVYFDASKFPDYGRLAGGSAHISGLQEGARVQANAQKRNATDFALWKFSPLDKKRQMEWDSPWGRGFPGWHIECSAMAMKYLGESFDIHCGGVDHIPIHHTNEIAQAEGATGKPFVRFWLHGEFLVLNKAKMAKSAGSFIKLSDLAPQGYDPLDYRYLCFNTHYRKQMEFSWESLEGAKSARRNLKDRVRDITREAAGKTATEEKARALLARFKERVSDDLDMPGALAALWDIVRPGPALDCAAALRAVDAAEEVLGLGLREAAEKALEPRLQEKFDLYVQARKRKDYAASDSLRKELAAEGVKIEDSSAGSRWRRE